MICGPSFPYAPKEKITAAKAAVIFTFHGGKRSLRAPGAVDLVPDGLHLDVQKLDGIGTGL